MTFTLKEGEPGLIDGPFSIQNDAIEVEEDGVGVVNSLFGCFAHVVERVGEDVLRCKEHLDEVVILLIFCLFRAVAALQGIAHAGVASNQVSRSSCFASAE